MGNRVVANVDVLLQSHVICPLLFLVWSRVTVCRVAVRAPQGCVRVMILAEPRSSYSLRLCAGHTSRRAARGSSQLFIFPSFYRLMRGLDTCLDLNVCGFFLRGSSSIFSSDRALSVADQHCATFSIPAELRPELPERNAIIKYSPEGKIGMYTHFIEFANYRIPLSKFLLCVLEYYHINLSQLSVIGAAKVSHFEVMCRALGRIPTLGTFRRFYVNLISNGWLSFSKRGVGTSVVKDPLPVDEDVDLPCVELFNENHTLSRKYPETFLCLVGLSRSFIETDVRPTLLYDNDEEMGLLDFVKFADPFKVKVGERTLVDNEVPLNTETEDRVISPSAQTISLVDHTIQDELNVNSGKRRKSLTFIFSKAKSGHGKLQIYAKDTEFESWESQENLRGKSDSGFLQNSSGKCNIASRQSIVLENYGIANLAIQGGSGSG
nr:hypothetical protein [Tanacetum cinerariifolium]